MATGYGIDFGTSQSTITVARANGTIRTVPNPLATTTHAVPSSALLRDGTILVGTAAENGKRSNLAAYRREFKLDFGSAEPYLLGETAVQPQQLAVALLRHLKQNADNHNSGQPAQVVITVPASWRQGLHRQMRDAATEAGFVRDSVTLLAEPIAGLGYAFSEDTFLDSKKILVYDLGGGTFDCALAERGTAGGFTLIGEPGGLDHIGGISFTNLLMSWAVDQVEEASQSLLNPGDSEAAQRFHLQLRDSCEEAKCVLSVAESADIELPNPARLLTVTRGTLDGLIKPLIVETVAECERLLNAARLSWDDVDVVPIGGSTRLKLVKDLLADHARRVLAVPEPELAVAHGAALHAHSLNEAAEVVTQSAAPEADDKAPKAASTSTLPPLSKASSTKTPSSASTGESVMEILVIGGLLGLVGGLLTILATLSFKYLQPAAEAGLWDWIATGWMGGTLGVILSALALLAFGLGIVNAVDMTTWPAAGYLAVSYGLIVGAIVSYAFTAWPGGVIVAMGVAAAGAFAAAVYEAN